MSTGWHGRIAPTGVLLLALCAYLGTLSASISVAPGVSDSGELAAAAYVLGVPHPTGSPLYMLVGWAVAHLPFGDPAHTLNVLSALCAAIAAALVAAIAVTVMMASPAHADTLLPASAPRADRAAAQVPPLAGCAAALGGIAFAGTPSFWLQATNTETRALAAALLAAALLAILLYLDTGSWRLLLLAWFLEGLGLADHLLCLALLPSLCAATLIEPGHRSDAARCCLATREGAMGARLRPAARPDHPRARLRRTAWTATALLPGLALYGYLPLRAAAGPAMDWGDPRTLSRFAWLVTGAQYRPLMGVPWDGIGAACGTRLGTLAAEMGTIVVLAGAAGFVLLSRRRPRIALLLGLAFVSGLLQSALYGAFAAPNYLIPCEMVLAATAAYCLTCLLGSVVLVARWARGRSRVPQMAILALALLLMGNGLRETGRGALAAGRASSFARGYALHTLADLPVRALILARGDQDTFPLWYAQFALGVRPDLAVVDIDLLAWGWYVAVVHTRYPWLRWVGPTGPDAQPALDLLARDDQVAARERGLVSANLRSFPILWTTPDDSSVRSCGIEVRGNLFLCVPVLAMDALGS